MVLPPEFGFEIPAIAELGDDVTVSVGGENFIALKNVGVIEFLEYIDFREEKLFQLL